jgi:hypothetical protein
MRLEEIDARLTAPGAPFEIVEEEVLGERMAVFRNRRRSLREVLAASAALGDREYVVHGERRFSYSEHLRLAASAARALRDLYGCDPAIASRSRRQRSRVDQASGRCEPGARPQP